MAGGKRVSMACGGRSLEETRALCDDRLSVAKRMSIVAEAADEEVQSGKVVLIPWYIIMPFHKWKANWDLTILGLVLISGFLIPFDVAYRHEGLDPEGCASSFLDSHCSFGFFFDCIDLILLAIFVVDLNLSFFVSFQDEDGKWRTTLRETIRRYARTWLTIDLLAIIPFDQFASSEGAVLGMFKVLRLLRLGKLLKRSQNLVTSTRAVLYRFTRMLLSVLMLTHWFACLLRYVSPNLSDDPFYLEIRESRGTGGLYVIDLYASLCLLLGESLMHENVTDEQALVAMLTMLIGAVVLAAVFGNVAMLVTNYNISKTRLMEKMEQVNESMKSCRLPIELQIQIRQYYAYSWMRHKTINAQGFFDDLSPGLRSKTTFYLYQDVLCAVPLFSKAPVAVLETLALAVRASVYMPGDCIIREGMYGEEMFIVGDGRVVVSTPDGVMVAVLGRGAYFGEMALLSDDRRRANRVEAESICDVYTLPKRDLDHIFTLYPKLRTDMLEEVAKRKEMNATMFEATISTALRVNEFANKVRCKSANLLRGLTGTKRDTSIADQSSRHTTDSADISHPSCAAPPAQAPTAHRDKRSSDGMGDIRSITRRLSNRFCGFGAATVAPQNADSEASRIAAQAQAMRREAQAAARVAAQAAASQPKGTVTECVDPNEDALERVRREHTRGCVQVGRGQGRRG